MLVDLWSCQRLLGDIRTLLDGANAPPVFVLARGRDLLACYRGHFLAGAGAAWASEPRDELRERVTTTLAELASRLESAGAVVEASQFYERAIEIDPTPRGALSRLDVLPVPPRQGGRSAARLSPLPRRSRSLLWVPGR